MKRRDFISLTFGTGLVSLVSGCMIDQLVEPLGPPDIIFIEKPPEIYKQWWVELENCSGKRRNFSDIKWYKYPGDSLPCDYSKEECDYLRSQNLYVFGTYNKWRNEIYMAEESLLTRLHVGHEILHALGFEHGSPMFEKCGVDSGILSRLGIDLKIDVAERVSHN